MLARRPHVPEDDLTRTLPAPDAEPTRRDLKLIAWVFVLIELIIAGLAAAAGRFAGRQAAIVVLVGFSLLTLASLLVVVGFSFIASWLFDRPTRPRQPRP